MLFIFNSRLFLIKKSILADGRRDTRPVVSKAVSGFLLAVRRGDRVVLCSVSLAHFSLSCLSNILKYQLVQSNVPDRRDSSPLGSSLDISSSCLQWRECLFQVPSYTYLYNHTLHFRELLGLLENQFSNRKDLETASQAVFDRYVDQILLRVSSFFRQRASISTQGAAAPFQSAPLVLFVLRFRRGVNAERVRTPGGSQTEQLVKKNE